MHGWQRLGVVLSVFWFVGFGWWLRGSDHDAAWNASGYRMCGFTADQMREGLRNGIDGWNDEKIDSWELECKEKASADFVRTSMPLWGIIVADAISLMLVWLLAWIVLTAGRWVAAGFRQQV